MNTHLRLTYIHLINFNALTSTKGSIKLSNCRNLRRAQSEKCAYHYRKP